jgi:hypothetical protein
VGPWNGLNTVEKIKPTAPVWSRIAISVPSNLLAATKAAGQEILYIFRIPVSVRITI